MSLGKNNHLPNKVFGTGFNGTSGAPPMAPNSHYNSHKNLRGIAAGANQTNTTTTNLNIGNNRYSS